MGSDVDALCSFAHDRLAISSACLRRAVLLNSWQYSLMYLWNQSGVGKLQVHSYGRGDSLARPLLLRSPSHLSRIGFPLATRGERGGGVIYLFPTNHSSLIEMSSYRDLSPGGLRQKEPSSASKHTSIAAAMTKLSLSQIPPTTRGKTSTRSISKGKEFY